MNFKLCLEVKITDIFVINPHTSKVKHAIIYSVKRNADVESLNNLFCMKTNYQPQGQSIRFTSYRKKQKSKTNVSSLAHVRVNLQ